MIQIITRCSAESLSRELWETSSGTWLVPGKKKKNPSWSKPSEPELTLQPLNSKSGFQCNNVAVSLHPLEPCIGLIISGFYWLPDCAADTICPGSTTVSHKHCHHLVGFGVAGKDDGGIADRWQNENSHVLTLKRPKSLFRQPPGVRPGQAVEAGCGRSLPVSRRMLIWAANCSFFPCSSSSSSWAWCTCQVTLTDFRKRSLWHVDFIYLFIIPGGGGWRASCCNR